MRYFFLLLFVVSFGYSQNKEQRYVIYNTEKILLVDSETGKCWQLAKDSVIVVPKEPFKSNVVKTERLLWLPVYFIDETTSEKYTVIPKDILEKLVENKPR